MVDNTLSPHGGVLIERVASREEGRKMIRGLPRLAIRDQIARECVDIAYGFFSPWRVSWAGTMSTQYFET